jgi:hypothetical protein
MFSCSQSPKNNKLAKCAYVRSGYEIAIKTIGIPISVRNLEQTLLRTLQYLTKTKDIPIDEDEIYQKLNLRTPSEID